MSSLDEVIAAAQADISAAEQAKAAIESTKSKIQEIQSQFAGLGADAKVSEAGQLQQTAEQAQQMFEPVKQKLEELVSQAQRAKSGTLGAGQSSAQPSSEPSIVVRPRDGDELVGVNFADLEAVQGDPVEPPQGGPDTPGGLQSELNSVDDDAMSKARRSFRTIARNAPDGRAQVKDTVNKEIDGLAKWIDPWGSEARTETRVNDPDTEPLPGEDLPHTDGDVVTAWTFVGSFAAEAGVRSIRRAQGKGE